MRAPKQSENRQDRPAERPDSSYRSVLEMLRQAGRPDKARFFPKFFQAYPGGYGDGDAFLGVIVPDQRRIAAAFKDLPLPEIQRLLDSRWHECRLTGLFILVRRFEHGDAKRQSELVAFYLDNLDRVNNWDLVDSSAHKILGAYLLQRPEERQILDRLAASGHLWRQRVAVIATLAFIKAGQYDDVFRLAAGFLDHPHDLIHKAAGWVLREAGKGDVMALRRFLDGHASEMPRIMLSYAIEKLPEQLRRRYLKSRTASPQIAKIDRT